MEEQKITETLVVEKIKEFLINKQNGNWHEEKSRISNLHEHGADIVMTGGSKDGERFIIECKGKSYAKSANSINKEGWLNALGQIITRMDVNRITNPQKEGNKPTINRAYKYGLGLCSESAQVALRRIPKNIAKTLNLHIFGVNDNGDVMYFTPKDFGKEYPKECFCGEGNV